MGKAVLSRYFYCGPPIRQAKRAAAVVVLLGLLNPAAVLWTVSAVYVDPIDSQVIGVPARKGPCLKGRILIPGLANCNSAATIEMVVFPRRGLASVPHIEPRVIEPSCCPAVLSPPVARRYSAEAAAVRRFALPQVRGQNGLNLSAGALA